MEMSRPFLSARAFYFCNRWFSIEMYIGAEYNKKYICHFYLKECNRHIGGVAYEENPEGLGS